MQLFIIILSLLLTAFASEDDILKEFKSGNRLLTSDIYRELRKKEDGNFLVSPLSVETVLALTLSGARGQTAGELQTSLRFPKKQIDNIFVNLLPELRSAEYALLSANKIYIKENFTIYDGFRNTAIDKYEAELENINFVNKPEAVTKINSWVEKQTQSKIRNIITQDDINNLTRLVLVNSLYFKGNWSNQFYSDETFKFEFYPKENEVISVDTMHLREHLNYYECKEVDAKFLELPFKGNDASLVVILPNDKNGISNLESKIDKVFTPRPFSKELVHVSFPKFIIETSIDFKRILQNLGVKKAFNGSEADLSGIAGEPGDLEISSIRQKTFIDLQEGGVEAAAATAVLVAIPISAPILPPPAPKYFKADHPFIFYIKIKDVILFGGKVLRPE